MLVANGLREYRRQMLSLSGSHLPWAGPAENKEVGIVFLLFDFPFKLIFSLFLGGEFGIGYWLDENNKWGKI